MNLFFLIWILFSISDGIEEAKVFEYKGVDIKWHASIHAFFNLQRSVILLSLLGSDLYFNGAGYGFIPFLNPYIDKFIVNVFAFMAVFPFYHDGFYYQTRNFLDYKKYNFFSKSTTTNAKVSFGFPHRLLLAIAGHFSFYCYEFFS